MTSPGVIPSAIMLTTVATGIRSPRIQGTPPIWLGFTVIRFTVLEYSESNHPGLNFPPRKVHPSVAFVDGLFAIGAQSLGTAEVGGRTTLEPTWRQLFCCNPFAIRDRTQPAARTLRTVQEPPDPRSKRRKIDARPRRPQCPPQRTERLRPATIVSTTTAPQMGDKVGEEEVASTRLASLPGCLVSIQILPWALPRFENKQVLMIRCGK